MKTRDSPPPVHVHVSETTPVHVHMRRSPVKTPQIKDAQRKEDGVKSKAQIPWIPPGRLSSQRDSTPRRKGSKVQHQSESGIHIQHEDAVQEDELGAMSKNLNTLLREQECKHSSKKTHFGASHKETDQLLRALVEAEIDGIAVANQLTALKETIDSLPKDKRLLKMDVASLRRQQDLLFEKIEMFDSTNHSLREQLRERTEYEKESLMWSEQNDALKKRLASCEAENTLLSTKLSNKEKEAFKLAEHLDFEKDNVKTNEELSRILESNRGHLESQLNRKEAENSILSSQIQRMQQSHEQHHEELQALQEELKTLRQQREEEQRRREWEADRVAESNRQLTTKLQEKESQLAQALSVSTDWCARHSKEAAAKAQLEEEISDIKAQVTELNSRLYSSDEKIRTEREELMDQLHHLSAETASTKLDNQRLKGQVMSSEEAVRHMQSEALKVKTSLKKQENQVEKYKKKVQQARLESEEYCLRLDVTQKEVREVKESLVREKDQVRRKMVDRLRELELLPEKLRRAELQLRQAQEEADGHERRNIQHNTALSEVRHKVEQQGTQLETWQQRNLLQQDENNVLKEKLQSLERKLQDLTLENKEKSEFLAMNDASIQNIQQQLEEKSCECSILSRQLEQTLDNTKRQVDDSMQRVLVKERVSQSKALDLQSQLSRAKTELSQLQRSKEEMERRCQSQLKNMKERLEQSDSTNRTLQNYVNFLKTSYGNVFSDSFPC
ncbi:outer dense fiber protein 2-like isoform X2 [Genypterus blacodes]|uniref:outer dense fiber protein 2-like isoform X2 n=1 Tax=Genypterus blacodes TaxID=154954 RepID=UPI003F76429B